MNGIMDQINDIQEEEDRNDILKFLLHLILKWDRSYYVQQKLKKLTDMSVEDILGDNFARNLFKKYLRLPLLNSPEILNTIKCYNICNKLIADTSLINDNTLINNLYSLCSSTEWESRIWSELRQHRVYDQQFGIIIVLNQLKQDCILDLITSGEYYQFKMEVKNKTNQMRLLIKSIYNENYVE